MGFSAISRTEIREIVSPELQNLAAITKQVVSLGILDQEDVVYIDRVQLNAFRLDVDIRIGTRIPTYYTVIGKSILAFLEEKKVRDILNSQALVDPYTKEYIDLRKLLRILKSSETKNGVTLNQHQQLEFWLHPY